MSLQTQQELSQSQSKTPGLTRGRRNIAWIERHCIVPSGMDAGKPVRLRDWQKQEILKIYDNPAGTRRAIISFGRKNGKTSLAAFLLLLHLCGYEAKRNSQLYSTAQSQDQAALVFDLASQIVRMSPTLRDFVKVRDTFKHLLCPPLGTIYKALSAETKTAYGLSPVFVIHDELGQVVGPRSKLYDALETAAGASSEPLSIIISTQAPTAVDLLSVLIDDSKSGADPRVTCSVYECPAEHPDPFSRDAIALANPALGDFLNERETLATAADAERMPARENEFRNLILNQRVAASSPFVSVADWKACAGEIKPITGVPVYGGLDLSSTRDLTAFVLIGLVDKVWQVHPTFWLPSHGLVEKSRHDRVPYDLWAKEGYLETSPGSSVEYEFVANHIAGLFQKMDIRKIGFDRWGMQHLRPWLIKAGMSENFIDERFEAFGQGTMSMSPALRVFEGHIANRTLAHGGHPVLTMCAANAITSGKDESCRKLTKEKSSGRIDGMVAAAMAFGVAPLDQVREFHMSFV